MTLRYPAIAPGILELFEERQAELVDVPIIQPADPFLDMAGEDLRRRIFLTESETGAQLCLRPEFTIPVCLDHIATRAATPHRYAYLGEVFRQRREGGNEFFQAGIEDLGESNMAEADARSVADAYALLTRTLPNQRLHVTLGDQTVFESVLAALGLPRGWQKRLARAFGSASQIEAALADLASPPRAAGLPPAIAELVNHRDSEALAVEIGEGMERAGLSATSGRSAEEIARRLIEKAELRSVRLSKEAFEALRNFLAIRTPLKDAAAALEAFARDAELTLGRALENFSARATALESHGLAVHAIQYDAAFGRPLDYYTGMVFEIFADDGSPTKLPVAKQPLAGGGRFDRLLTLLGATKPIPAVGFSVWLDRIERAGIQSAGTPSEGTPWL